MYIYPSTSCIHYQSLVRLRKNYQPEHGVDYPHPSRAGLRKV